MNSSFLFCTYVNPGIVMLGLLYDTIINCSKCGQGISDYVLYVFSSTITVSVLCFTLISLVASFSGRECFGYKLQDVLQFPESPVNIQKYTRASLGIALASTISLAIAFFFRIELNGVMTALLIVLLITELTVADKLYKMLFNEKELVAVITKYFKAHLTEPNRMMNYEEFKDHTKRIFSELAVCIEERDWIKKEDIHDMLLLLVQQLHKNKKNFQQSYDYFYDATRMYIESLSEAFGYSEMLRFISRIYREIPEEKHTAQDLYLIPLEKLRFRDDKFLLEHPYYKEISEIYQLDEYMNGAIPDDSVKRIMFAYFENVIYNQLVALETKEELIDQFIKLLMNFSWNSVEEMADVVEPDLHVLLKIHKFYVLEKKVSDLQLPIFHSLGKNAYLSQASFWGGDRALIKYYDFLALFFQSFYSCAFCETEMLSDEYRIDLQTLYKTPIVLAATDIRGINQLMYSEIQGVLHAMERRILMDETILGKIFELYKKVLTFKNVIWTTEFNVNYFFMLYLIYYSQVMAELVVFVSNNELADDKKIDIFSELQNKFDLNTGNLTDAFTRRCVEYGKFLEHPFNLPNEIQNIIFGVITQTHLKLKREFLAKHQSDKITIDNSEIQVKLNERMEMEQVFGWTTDLEISSDQVSVIPIVISPRKCKRNQYKDEHIIKILRAGIIDAVQKQIQIHSQRLELTFNLSGVEKLLSFLQSAKYTARNYTYTNDRALIYLGDMPNFKRLREEELNLAGVDTDPFFENMYFVKDAFRFCAKVTKIEKEILTDEECVTILEHSQTFNGKYVVDGALMSKTDAIDYIINAYWKESYQFDLVVGWDICDLTYINFDLPGSLLEK